jgi:tetratricopeptide (TPR) repeat protein
VLAVDEHQHNPDEIFALAVAADETGDVGEAERLYRIVTKGDPRDAAAPFNLGNMLRACGRKAEAEAALRAATRLDPSFAEAWYNLSDLLDEQGRTEPPSNAYARRCLSRLTISTQCSTWPCCCNEKINTRRPPTIGAADAKSEWAARARRSLKFCEMQVHLLASA